MEITITYRPLTGTINAWDTINDIMSENDLKNIVTSFTNGDENQWTISYSTYANKFHDLAVIDCDNQGQGWNLFLTEYLPDDIITAIANQITEWQTQCPSDADPTARLLARYQTTISV